MKRQLDWRSLLSLRAPVLATLLLVWNVGLVYGMHAGGGGIDGLLAPAGREIARYVFLGFAAFSLAVASCTPLQQHMVAPSRAGDFRRDEFYFLACVFGILWLCWGWFLAPSA